MVHSDTLLHGQIWLCLQQYTYAYKDYNKNLKPGLKKSLLPLCYVIKPFPWWTTMLKLQVGHIMAVTGFLLHVLQKNDGKVQFFEVEVDQVNILGKRSVLVGPNQFAHTVKSIFFFLWLLSQFQFNRKPHQLLWSAKGFSLISVRQLLAHSRKQESQTPRCRLLLYLNLNNHLYINTYSLPWFFKSNNCEYYQERTCANAQVSASDHKNDTKFIKTTVAFLL